MPRLTQVVNVYKETYDIYIARPRGQNAMHYGNPIGLKGSKIAAVIVGTRREAVEAFYAWLKGVPHPSVPNLDKIEPERRLWILENLEALRGQKIGCFCAPQLCHGNIYRVLLGEISLEEALGQPERVEIQHDFFTEAPSTAPDEQQSAVGSRAEVKPERPKALAGQLDLFG